MPDANAPDGKPDNFGDLPIQPTGSGVADLEVAYEQMKLDGNGDGDDAAAASIDAGIADETAAYDAAMTPTEDGDDTQASAAHPS